MDQQQFNNILERYIDGELSPDERDKFLDEVNSNYELKQKFNLRLSMKQHILGQLTIDEAENDPDIDTIRQELAEEAKIKRTDHSDEQELVEFIKRSVSGENANTPSEEEKRNPRIENAPSRLPSKRKLYTWSGLIAASVAILIAVAVSFNDVTTAELFSENYSRLEPISYSIRGVEEDNESFQEALDAYSSGEAEQAILLLDKMGASNILSEEVSLYKGLAYLDAGEADQAVTELNYYLNTYNDYHFEARWYLALANIQLNNPEQAKESLIFLAGQISPYQEPAKKLLSRLDRIK